MSSDRADPGKLRSLTTEERGLLAAAVVVVPGLVVLLRLLGYGRVEALGIRLSRSRPGPADPGRTIDAATRMVDLVTTRLPLRPACLPRSVALWFLLRRRGIDSEVCIGVRSGGAPLDAHAWVEVDGQPVNDDPDIATRYATLRRPGRPPE